MRSTLSKIFDLLAAPAPAVDHYGEDATAKNIFSRLTSRTDFVIPAAVSVPLVTAHAAVTQSNLSSIIYVAGGSYLAYTICREVVTFGQLFPEWISQKLFNTTKPPEYYLDRTKPGASSLDKISDQVVEELHQSKRDSVLGMIISSGAEGAILALEIKHGLFEPLTPLVFSSYFSDCAGAYWRAHQALTGHWQIIEHQNQSIEPAIQPAFTPL